MAINIPPPTTVTTAVAVAVLPPGANTVILSNTGANPAYIGLSNSVVAANGFPLPVGATITIPTVVGSKGATLWAQSTGAVVGVIVSTAQ